MDIQDQLKQKKRTLERLGDNSNLESQREKLQELRAIHTDGGPASLKIIEEQESRVAEIEGMDKHLISTLQAEIDQLQAQVDQQTADQRKVAREELKAKKEEARAEWLDGGGTNEGFEQVWPSIKDDLLKTRTLAALESVQSAPRDMVAKKKAELLKARALAAVQEKPDLDQAAALAKKRSMIGGL